MAAVAALTLATLRIMVSYRELTSHLATLYLRFGFRRLNPHRRRQSENQRARSCGTTGVTPCVRATTQYLETRSFAFVTMRACVKRPIFFSFASFSNPAESVFQSTEYRR